MTPGAHNPLEPLPPLRWGILGCGRVFERYHLPAIESLDGWEVTAAWDPRQFRLRWLAESRPGIELLDSSQAVLDHAKIDAVLISSPPAYHPAQAAAAVERGRPVLVEKPFALDGEAGQFVADMAQAAGVPLGVGFTRRFRRSYRQARAGLQSEGLALLQLEFEICSPLRSWDPIAPEEPGWDALSDIGSHQVDLLAWMMNQRITRARGWSEPSTEWGRETVRFELTLDDGQRLMGVACHGGQYRERLAMRTRRGWQIANERGYLELPPLMGWLENPVSLGIAGWRRMSGRPDPSHDSFRQQYLAFAQWLREGEKPQDLADASDGAAAAAVIAAIRSSVEQEGEPVDVHLPVDGERAHRMSRMALYSLGEISQPVSGREARFNGPDISIVLVVGDRRQRGAQALASLLQQPGIESEEILLLDAASSSAVAPIDGSDHPAVRLERVQSAKSFGELRAKGATQARGKLIAFLEEHVTVMPGWLEACRAHLESNWDGVGGEMHNANPELGISDIIALMNYTAWRPPARAGQTTLVPGQNNLYRREALMKYAPELADLLENESVLNTRMSSAGYRLCIDPELKFSHRNEVNLPLICYGYFHWHRNYGANRVKSEGKGWLWRVLRAGSWPLVPVVRAWRMGSYLRDHRPGELGFFIRWLPTVLITQGAAGLGMAIGILAGPGNSAKRFLEHELNVDRPLPHRAAAR